MPDEAFDPCQTFDASLLEYTWNVVAISVRERVEDAVAVLLAFTTLGHGSVVSLTGSAATTREPAQDSYPPG